MADGRNEEHRWGYNPFLSANFCQDCGVCDCPEHNMVTLHTGQPPLAGVEDYIPPKYRFLRNPVGCGARALAEETRRDIRCGKPVGSKPYWMGNDQYDPCVCLLGPGHDGECKCEHTIDNDSGAAAPGSE